MNDWLKDKINQLNPLEVRMAKKYSSWDNSKTAEYVATADKMLKKFNPNNKEHPVNRFGADYRGLEDGVGSAISEGASDE